MKHQQRDDTDTHSIHHLKLGFSGSIRSVATSEPEEFSGASQTILAVRAGGDAQSAVAWQWVKERFAPAQPADEVFF